MRLKKKDTLWWRLSLFGDASRSIFYKHSGKLIGQDDVQTLLDNLSQSAPSLVESLVPKLVPLHNLTGVLRELLSERVPISDLRIILESLAGLVSKTKCY